MEHAAPGWGADGELPLPPPAHPDSDSEQEQLEEEFKQGLEDILVSEAADESRSWPPVCNAWCLFPNASVINIDSSNGRYFARKPGVGGLRRRLCWGGKAKGYPNLSRAWNLACEWSGISADSDEVKELFLSGGLGPDKDTQQGPRSAC